jgi:hypothetical protein
MKKDVLKRLVLRRAFVIDPDHRPIRLLRSVENVSVESVVCNSVLHPASREVIEHHSQLVGCRVTGRRQRQWKFDTA